MDGHPDFYTLLGVAPQAEPDVIRAAYRVLAQRYHPDRQGQAHASTCSHMAALNQAYDTLSCPQRRRAYDQWRRQLDERAHVSWGNSPAMAPPLTTRPSQPSVLTTYDRRGRLHAFI